MMSNTEFYDRFRSVPKEAQKTITGGRLNGMTDINPMWRIRCLTEAFGPCGIGWKPLIKRTWLEAGTENEVVANVEIELYIKVDGEWSDGIPGIGGSKFMTAERNGVYTDDEAYKKAYTDALSVACKALGFGADVYWQKGTESKYGSPDGSPAANKPVSSKASAPSKFAQVNELLKTRGDITLDQVAEWISKKYGKSIKINDLPDEQFAELMAALKK